MSAAKAAHFTSTSHPKPSIFEVIAQGTLTDTLHPALQRLLHFLADCRPDTFGWIADCCDELYLLANGAVQYHYLNKHDASFSEHFYGLKRVSLGPAEGYTGLTEDKRKLSLLYLVVLPYLRIKIEQKLAIYRLELADGVVFHKWERHVKGALCLLQAIGHLAWQCWIATQLLRYMSGQSETATPALYLCRLTLSYATPDANLPGWAFGLGGCLELFAFLMQFLRSWASEDARRDLTELPAPPAPAYEPHSAQYRRTCPVCMQSWCVPTVLTVSGYVYCFRCLTHSLQQKQSCPVTGLPANQSHMVRLYHT